MFIQERRRSSVVTSQVRACCVVVLCGVTAFVWNKYPCCVYRNPWVLFGLQTIPTTENIRTRNNDIFDADDTDAVLLNDASNAFTSLNRASALHNDAVLCPLLAKYANNTYMALVPLFVTGGEKLKSTEGTTRDDPLEMSLCTISLQPLITHFNQSSNSKQYWYADDATGACSLEELKKWWDGLNEIGPSMGYYLKLKSAGWSPNWKRRTKGVRYSVTRQ